VPFKEILQKYQCQYNWWNSKTSNLPGQTRYEENTTNDKGSDYPSGIPSVRGSPVQSKQDKNTARDKEEGAHPIDTEEPTQKVLRAVREFDFLSTFDTFANKQEGKNHPKGRCR
jgi:hypothetical protein